MPFGLKIEVLAWAGVSGSQKCVRSVDRRDVWLERPDEEVALGTAGREGRINHD